MSEGIEDLLGVWSSDGSYYSVPIEDMNKLIAEVRRLRDENVRLRDNVRDEALKMVEDMYPSSEVR